MRRLPQDMYLKQLKDTRDVPTWHASRPQSRLSSEYMAGMNGLNLSPISAILSLGVVAGAGYAGYRFYKTTGAAVGAVGSLGLLWLLRMGIFSEGMAYAEDMPEGYIENEGFTPGGVMIPQLPGMYEIEEDYITVEPVLPGGLVSSGVPNYAISPGEEQYSGSVWIEGTQPKQPVVVSSAATPGAMRLVTR